ncbi:MAG: glycosyltransferase family 39 protein [bacterium]|nr:glycosyltransferase family 39 protein [bacterium]
MTRLRSLFEKYGLWPIMALAALLRFSNLAKRDFWYDEAFTGIVVRSGWSEMFKELINDIHPPFYYILVKLFGRFFNYNVFGLRLFSVVFGLLAVWLVYLLAKEIFDRETGLWSALIAAIAPIAIQYSQEARMYSLLVCLFLTATLFFLKGLETGSKKYFLIWGIFLGLAALTHYMAIIMSPIFLIILALKFFSSPEKKKIIKGVLYGCGAAFLVFLPWLNNFNFQLNNLKEKELTWVTPAKISDIFLNIQMFLFGTPLGEMSQGVPQPNVMFFALPTTVLLAVVILISLITVAVVKKRGLNGLLAAVFSFGSLLIVYGLSLAGKQYFVSRYLLPAGFFFFILIGAWLSQTKQKTAISCFLAYLLILNFGINYSTYSTGWNKIAEKKYADHDIYVLNSFDYVIAKYYLGDEKLFLYNIDWPQYNPQNWAGIGKNIKRIEDYQIIKKDSNALIFSNGEISKINSAEISIAQKYDNILVYKFR